MIGKLRYFFVICLLVTGVIVHAQTTSTATVMPSTQLDTSGLPLWVKDLRRAEIVAFGAFPLTMLLAITAVDTYRFINHDMDGRYAPLIKSAGGIEMTDQEKIITLTSAAVGSLLISLADFLIVQHKRYKQKQRNQNLQEGTPIIIRKPLQEAENLPGAGNP